MLARKRGARPSSAVAAAPGVVAIIVAVFGALTLGCGSATDDRPDTWSYIWPTIIRPSCATVSCHSAVAARSDVVLEGKDVAYHTLLDRNFVIERVPTQSEVLFLLRGSAVARMPPDFPLPPADILLISDWIAKGAPND